MSKDIENNQLTTEEEKQVFENLKNISWTLNNSDQDKGDEKLCSAEVNSVPREKLKAFLNKKVEENIIKKRTIVGNHVPITLGELKALGIEPKIQAGHNKLV